MNDPTIKRRTNGTHGTTAKQRKRARNRAKAAEKIESEARRPEPEDRAKA